MDASALEYERVMEKKKQLLIKIQETKTGIRNKQNQLKILEEGLQKNQGSGRERIRRWKTEYFFKRLQCDSGGNEN